MTTFFPLFRLSPNDLRKVLRYMGVFELFILSTLTARARSSVASLNLKYYTLEVRIYEEPIIQANLPGGLHLIWRFTYAPGTSLLNRPASVTFTSGILSQVEKRIVFESRQTNPCMFTWIRQIRAIFRAPYVKPLWISSRMYPPEDIRDAIGKFKSLYVTEAGTDEQNLQFMKVFGLERKLSADCRAWQARKPFGSVLIRNFDFLDMYNPTTMTLDDMLLLNSKTILYHVNAAYFNGKDLNRFIKLWMKGDVPRMEFLQLKIDRNNIVEFYSLRRVQRNIFKGITHREVPRDQKRFFKFQGERHEQKGGFDIEGKCGTMLTVLFQCGTTGDVTMYVWNR